MFGFMRRKDREINERAARLAETLMDVGVRLSEFVLKRGGKAWMVMPTAENVLLRLADERDHYKELADNASESVAVRNFALERSARSAERVAYADALRIAGREKGELVTKLAAAELELQQVFEVLVAHGYHAEIEDDAEINLPAAVCSALKAAEKVGRTERYKVVGADVTRNGNPVVDRFDATHLSAKAAQAGAEWAAKAIEDFMADEARVDQVALSLECMRAVADDDGLFKAEEAYAEFCGRGGKTWLLTSIVGATDGCIPIIWSTWLFGARPLWLEFLGRGADNQTPTWRLRDV